MIYDIYTQHVDGSYKVAILTMHMDKDAILKHYIKPAGINPDDVIIFQLTKNPAKKTTPRQELLEHYNYIKEELDAFNVGIVIVDDGDYFKAITKETKTDANVGYFFDLGNGREVTYMPTYKRMFFDPVKTTQLLASATQKLSEKVSGSYQPPGTNVIKFSKYIDDYEEAKEWLEKIKVHDRLAVDIEGYSLKFYECDVGSIAFSWNENEGISIFVGKSQKFKMLLRNFFDSYKGKTIYHHAPFDVTCLIYNLYMDYLTDQKGLLKGLSVMTRDVECTRIISYLATNSCAGNQLGLKEQAREFIGNYAVDVKDISLLSIPELLKYNLEDTLATWFVFNKNHPIMIKDNQEDIYENLFKPALKDVIQMQLTGMPILMDKVHEAEKLVTKDIQDNMVIINNSSYIDDVVSILKGRQVISRNAKLKTKVLTVDDVEVVFNPNSSDHLNVLLYQVLKLPILQRTESKQPATGKKVIEALLNHTKDAEAIELLKALNHVKDGSKILSAFIPHFKKAPYCTVMKHHFIFGNFNLGGTVSGRLSSSDINLQQIPSKGRYAKIIMSCFGAPDGWLFIGIDADSLEDKVSALTTKDENKLKVYTDGYCGHSFRAYSYYPEQLSHLPNTVEGINSIKKLFPELRDESKVPTFLLTYWGTYHGLMRQAGFSEEKAKTIEERFKTLYAQSLQYITDKLNQAAIDGYVDVAFGLRVRTPLLHQTIMNTRSTPYEAQAEFRTAANACGQSYCMLNTRAAMAFMQSVRASEYVMDIKPCAHIHDASYYMVRNDAKIVKFCNDNLVKEYAWQELPELHHDIVKLSGTLGIFYPSWYTEHPIKNNASLEDIYKLGEEIANG